MATIVISHDPSGLKAKDINKADGCLIEWLLAKYPEGFKVPTTVCRGNARNIIDLNDYPDGLKMTGDEVFLVDHQPAGLNDLVTFALVGALIAINTVDDLKQESIDFDTQTAGSPNNKINGQRNTARLTEKVPQIYGIARSYPDIIFPSYGEWIDNEWILIEYFMLSAGTKSSSVLSEVRRGETDVFNELFSIFPPEVQAGGKNAGFIKDQLYDLASDPDLQTFNVRRSLDASGQHLKGTNLGGDILSITALTNTDTGLGSIIAGKSRTPTHVIITDPKAVMMIGSNAAFVATVNDMINNFDKLSPGDLVDVVEDNPTGSSFSGIHVYETHGSGSFSGFTYVWCRFSDVNITPAYNFDIGRFVTFESSLFDTTGTAEFGPFKLPIDCTQIWLDIDMPKGVVASDGSQGEIEILVEVESLTGPFSDSTTFSIFGKSNSPKNKTLKIIGLTLDSYEVTITRTNDEDDGTGSVSDNSGPEAFLSELKAVDDIDSSKIDTEKVCLLVKTKSGQSLNTSGKMNAKFERGIPIFDFTAKTFGAEATTQRFDEILMNHMVFVGKIPIGNINTDDLKSIVLAVGSSSPLMKFNYTFAGKNTPLDDDIALICNACRVTAYKQGSVYRFYRDQTKFITTVFSIRDKAPESDRKTRTFMLPNSKDGVELEFKNELNNFETETVFVPVTATRRKKIPGVGITNLTQATNRADYEFNKMIHQHTSFKTRISKKGLLPDLGDRIRISDNTRIDNQSGELLRVSIDGFLITLSEKINFSGASDGTLRFSGASIKVVPNSGFVVTAFSAGNAAAALNLEQRGIDGNQVGSTYVFVDGDTIGTPAQDLVNPTFTLINRTESDDYAELTCVNYSDEVFDGD